jgi:hypothetical protein
VPLSAGQAACRGQAPTRCRGSVRRVGQAAGALQSIAALTRRNPPWGAHGGLRRLGVVPETATAGGPALNPALTRLNPTLRPAYGFSRPHSVTRSSNATALVMKAQ